MKIDDLLSQISEAEPCGPDLSANMDPEFEDYYFTAVGRLPDFIVQPGVGRPDGSRTPDRVFDPASVDIAAEARAIDDLLARSRDIRLLVLRAQWETLAGRLPQMAEAVAAIAALLEVFPNHAHPMLKSGVSERREAINDLAQPVAMVQALQFVGLTGNSEVTLRKLRVAGGLASPLQEEQDLSRDALMDALGQASYRKKVDDAHAAVLSLLAAIAKIEKLCQTNLNGPFSPALEDLRKVATEIAEVITQARPDLRGAEATPAPVAPPTSEQLSALQEDAPPAAVHAEVAAVAPSVVSALHARRILEACERYYRRHEPSSAALLLVTQARLLIGRPLIEALETLLPEQYGQAIVDFGPQTGFRISIEQLRILTQAAPDDTAGLPEPDPGPDPEISSGRDAAAAIRAVEDYFRKVERSSPVPVLLQRARTYLERDFQSLVDELLPGTQNR